MVHKSNNFRGYTEVYNRYGLTLSRKKTETMVINGTHDETYASSLITLGECKIKKCHRIQISWCHDIRCK